MKLPFQGREGKEHGIGGSADGPPMENPGASRLSHRIGAWIRSGAASEKNSSPGPVSASLQDREPGILPPSGKVLDRYWLKKGFSYTVIEESELFDILYRIVEPEVDVRERMLLEEVHSYLRDVLVYDTVRKKGEINLSYEVVRDAVRRFVDDLPEQRIRVIFYYLERNLQGYGSIDPLMHDRFIEDISCNGSDSPVFIYHNEFGSIPTSIRFTAAELNKYVLKLSQKADRQISISTPLLDAPLPDGSRAQITYTDVVSSRGSSFTIRRFKSDPMTPVDLIRFGTYDPEILAFLWLAVENRKSMIIVGGTASGKTSTMNAISYFIPLTAKIVSLEDTREIQLPHKNWLPTRTRETSSQSGKGEIDLFSLLRSSLRQRPEYIIVGEVRGPESQTLFQAMNTGHTTYSTLHAGSVDETVNRLVNPPINVPRAMFGALDLMVVQLLQYQDGKAVRRCLSLNEVTVDGADKIRAHELYSWNPRSDTFQRNFNRSRVLDSIAYARGWTQDEIEEQIAHRRHTLELMAIKGIQKSSEVSGVFHLMRKAERFHTSKTGEAADANP